MLEGSGCSCSRTSGDGVIRTCPKCCSAAIRAFLGCGIDNRELFAQVDSRVSVSGPVEGEDPVQALDRWFEATGRDPLVL